MTTITTNGTKTAAIYCRVSTAEQVKGTSLESQAQECREYARQQGLQVIYEVAEDISGAKLARPGLDHIRDMAERGELSAVIVFDPDRLSRSLGHLMFLSEDFQKRRVQLHFVNSPVEDNPEGRMLFGMRGLFAEYERGKITERMRRGRHQRIHQGRVMVGPHVPYGYDVDREKGRLTINPIEAMWVERMFTWLVHEHCTLGEVARRLEAAGVLTKRDKAHWQRASVQAIVTNTTCMGTWYYNKYERTPVLKSRKNDGVERYSKASKPESEWLAVQVPAIVSPELFTAAGKQMKVNKATATRNTRYPYLLTGMLRCQGCNYMMQGTKMRHTHYYRCPARTLHQRHLPLDKRCSARSWQSDYLDGQVWDAVVEHLQDEDRIMKTLESREQQSLKQRRKDEDELLSLHSASDAIKRDRNKLLDLYLEEPPRIDKETLQERMVPLDKKQASLEAVRLEIEARIHNRETTEATQESVKRWCALAKAGLHLLTFEDRREFLQGLELQCTIHRTGIILNWLLSDPIELMLTSKLDKVKRKGVQEDGLCNSYLDNIQPLQEPDSSGQQKDTA